MYIKKRALAISLALSLSVAAAVTVIMLQQHAVTRTILARWLNTLIRESFDCDFDMRIETLRILPLTLVCSSVTAKPSTNAPAAFWRWHADTVTFRCSWLSLIFLRKLSTSIEVDQLTAESYIDQHGAAITQHIKDLFFGQKKRVPLFIKAMKINQITMKLDNNQHAVHAQITAHVSSKKVGPHLKSTIYVSDGWCTWANQTAAAQLNGIVNSTFTDRLPYNAWINATLALPHLPAQSRMCHISGQLTDAAIAGTVQNTDQTLLLQGSLNLATQDFDAHGHLDSSLVQPYIDVPRAIKNYNDTLTFNATGNLKARAAKGTCTMQKLPLTCDWRAATNTIAITMRNNGPLPLALGWYLPTNAINARIERRANEHYELNTTVQATDGKKKISGQLALRLQHESFKCDGALGAYHFQASGSVAPIPRLDNLTIKTSGALLATFKTDVIHKQAIFGGSVNYHALTKLFPALTDHIPGSGMLIVNGTATTKEALINLALKNGAIVLPDIDNTLVALETQARIDLEQRAVWLHKLICHLQRGTVTSPLITCYADEHFMPTFAHIPVSFVECLAHWNGSLMLFSGGIIGTYNGKQAALEGALTINKAHLEEHTFATSPVSEGKALACSNRVHLNVAINTSKPIRIKTPELHSKAALDLAIIGTLEHPLVDGTITLRGGSVAFPYTPLKITQGTLYLSQADTFDPTIDLYARSPVNQYIITAHLTGSISHPVIHLESAPPLEEQQIAGLLIAGSTNSLLNANAAGLVIDNIAHYVADNLMQTSRSNRVLASLLKPLKHIKFTPLIGEQPGLNNVSGSLEVDLGNRLKARLQKKLQLDEDPALELDYRLTDELSVKAFKNEKGDVGGLLQMRIKA